MKHQNQLIDLIALIIYILKKRSERQRYGGREARRTTMLLSGLLQQRYQSKSAQHLNEVEIAKELDRLSSKLDHVDEIISSAIASDPQVKSLLSGTADVWLPVITANSEERLNFNASFADDYLPNKNSTNNNSNNNKTSS